MSNQLTELLWPITTLTRALTNNAKSTSFPSIVPTTTLPATVDAVVGTSNVFVTRGGYRYLALTPFGTDAANETFDIEVYGWSLCGDVYVPHALGGYRCTLGAKTGVDGSDIEDEELFADTIAASATPVDDPDVIIDSPTGDYIGQIFIPTRGHEFLEVTFDLITAASANVLYRYL